MALYTCSTAPPQTLVETKSLQNCFHLSEIILSKRVSAFDDNAAIIIIFVYIHFKSLNLFLQCLRNDSLFTVSSTKYFTFNQL